MRLYHFLNMDRLRDWLNMSSPRLAHRIRVPFDPDCIQDSDSTRESWIPGYPYGCAMRCLQLTPVGVMLEILPGFGVFDDSGRLSQAFLSGLVYNAGAAVLARGGNDESFRVADMWVEHFNSGPIQPVTAYEHLSGGPEYLGIVALPLIDAIWNDQSSTVKQWVDRGTAPDWLLNSSQTDREEMIIVIIVGPRSNTLEMRNGALKDARHFGWGVIRLGRQPAEEGHAARRSNPPSKLTASRFRFDQ